MQLDQVKRFFETQEETYKKIEDEGVIMSIGDGIVKACGFKKCNFRWNGYYGS